MRFIITFLSLSFLAARLPAVASTDGATPTQLLEKMDERLRGPSHEMTVTLDVKTKHWERHYKIRVWMKGLDFALAQVLEPPKVKGEGFLRIKTRLWHYLPSAERTILIPPSLMLDHFMGSDFSNDDFVKMSYLARDYNSKIVGEEEIDGSPGYHLELEPRADAPVTYGKLEVWLRKKDAAPLRWDFYNEKLERIRTLHYSKFRTFGTREVPAVWRMENHKDKDRETTVTILDAKYEIDIPDSFFTRQNMEHPL